MRMFIPITLGKEALVKKTGKEIWSNNWIFCATTLASLIIIFCTVTSCLLSLMQYSDLKLLRKTIRTTKTPETFWKVDYDFMVHPLTNEKRNFSDAEAWCVQTLKPQEGHLAVVRTQGEDRMVSTIIKYAPRRDIQDCPYFLIGQREMPSRIWRSKNGRSFVPSLQIPYQYDFREDSNDCFIFDFNSMVSTTVACSTMLRCAICEATKDCGNKYLGPEGSCYIVEAFGQHNPMPMKSTDSQTLHPLRTFNDFQRVCRRHHAGRLGAFDQKHVPKIVAAEIKYEIEHFKLLDVCQGKIAARGVEMAHEYETAEEEHISYWSDSLTDLPSSNHCLGITENSWLRVPCQEKSCFVCAYRVFHDESLKEPNTKMNDEEESDLNPLLWG